MTKIKPFRALIYNQEKISDLSRVVCPPYDVISASAQEHYHNLDAHNLIHLILGRDLPSDNKYERAGSYFRKWQQENILIPDKQPAIYFYSQEYNLKGERKTRVGFIALLSLPDEKSKIFAHEKTRLEPKTDRLKLIRQVKANLSPIFVLFSDKGRIIQRLYEKDINNAKPFIDITDEEKCRHCLWRVTSADIIDKITSQLNDKNIFIADGHHRYEVAQDYRDEVRKLKGKLDLDDDCNYVLAYFTSVESKGLTILPIHRLVLGPADFNMMKLLKQLEVYFFIEEKKDKADFFLLMQKCGLRQPALGMYKDRVFYLLRLKNLALLKPLVDNSMPKEYNNLDISILNYVILKKIFNLDLENKERIIYHQDADKIISMADEEGSRIGFFLNPVTVDEMMAVAVKNVRMPSKSTFFYPKVLSGLLINKFKED